MVNSLPEAVDNVTPQRSFGDHVGEQYENFGPYHQENSLAGPTGEQRGIPEQTGFIEHGLSKQHDLPEPVGLAEQTDNIVPQKSFKDVQKFPEVPAQLNGGFMRKAITGETLPEIQGENGLESKALPSTISSPLGDLQEFHRDLSQQQMSEQEEAAREDKAFSSITASQEATIKKFGGLLPPGDISRPDLYLQDQGALTRQLASAHEESHEEEPPHIERKQYDDDYVSPSAAKSFKKDLLPSSTNTTTKATASEPKKGEEKPKTSSNQTDTATSPLDNNIVNNTAHAVSDQTADQKPHGLNIEISKSKSISFDNPSGVKLSTSSGSLKNESSSNVVANRSKRAKIARKSELVLKKLGKAMSKLRKEKPKTERGDKKNAVVVNRPPVVYHPPPEIYHRPPLILHRPPLVINRPPIVYHQPPVIVHRPAVVYNQPPLIFHQPPPAVHQPLLHSHDQFMTVPQLQHIGSHVQQHGSFMMVPQAYGYRDTGAQIGFGHIGGIVHNEAPLSLIHI